MQVQRQGEWLSAMVGSECVMMSTESGNYISLSRVGARIWELIAQPTSLAALCDQLVLEFDVPPDVCRAEVEAFLDELVKQHAATLVPAAS
jgi:hypothetical protein